ncbi:protein adenylyltransferase SelO [Methylobacterium trifolii]|uniref:Protein nucleotidyltransferase YdiU n=1 Tax=Methylobacterium trifolii TaxID=1003092 RepID=A0ABQ4TU36_9HYPH|nr:YdiU family protein [Methylobacterium trifolii]GJE58798.1 Protein adenylyltransferase SelO [Methylobacterium trifolii]
MTPIPFDNSYARLPERFFARRAPTPVAAPRLIHLNRGLAVDLGLDAEWFAGPEGVTALAGNSVPDGAEPIAAAYAGHQFGNFVPQLGDGRAVLLGEVIDRDGQRRDIQLKGSGPTPFSRRGDGRAALGPVLREYLVSEAMAALGIPTTRALAAVATGERVVRETLLPGAILTRVAASHIRVGTFQFFAARDDVDALRALADHAIVRHYPEALGAEESYLALLEGIVARQADLVAAWLNVGFVHGVMNTDNMSVAGETIDYGPCAFLDAYDPRTVYSSIDARGRYAYGKQPGIALWNLTRLAEALLPLLGTEDAAVVKAEAALSAFKPRFEAAYRGGLARKLGLSGASEGDVALADDLLARMAENQADFTLTFRRLCDAAERPEAHTTVRDLFVDPTAYDAWVPRWRERLRAQAPAVTAAAMRTVNPAFVPRNHRVEAMIEAAVERDDFAPFEELLSVLSRPYEDQPSHAHYAEAPEDGGAGYRTYCGT